MTAIQEKPATAVKLRSLIDIVERQAQVRGDHVAFDFIDEGSLTFRQVWDDARNLGAWLQQFGEPTDRCIILLPPGAPYLRAFLACLLADRIAVPCYLPEGVRWERGLPRMADIVRDAQATVLITVPEVANAVPLSQLFAEAGIQHIVTLPQAVSPAPSTWQVPRLGSQDLAFLQYTSGSTSRPKGVMVTHGSLLANLEAYRSNFAIDDSWHGVTWLPPYHDMGLIGGLLQPLYTGFTMHVLPTTAFLRQPLTWLQAITAIKDHPVISCAPNFAYDLCVHRATPDTVAALDLRHWHLAMCGAEPVRVKTLERFVQTFAPTGFERSTFAPGYGLAEATLMVSGHRRRGDDPVPVLDLGTSQHLSCGRVIADHEAIVVDPQTHRRLPEDCEGEIWVSGPSVAAGYWHKDAVNADVFKAMLTDRLNMTHYLRTGDLGVVQNGELFITGRLKDMIVAAGRKHYPQDIETTLHGLDPALRPGCAVAFAWDQHGDEDLIIVQEVDVLKWDGPLHPLLQRITGVVAETHGIAPASVVLIAPYTLPKTTSGKLQRGATRQHYANGTLQVVAQWSRPQRRA